ncbi:MAG: hypothetical protein FGM61_02330 [Sediminibacterium sp.]|nr:hypothetical protein [Sediminibacterium sp.]
MQVIKKFFRYIIVFLLLAVAPFVYWRYYYTVADGTQAGSLNVFQKKGLFFKTYEGKLIQSGFKANIQSNEFSFSVTDPRLADQLMKLSGKELNLHYKQYLGSLPWRGMQVNIVDSIYEVRDPMAGKLNQA